MPERVFSFDSSEIAVMKKVLEYDPYLDGSLSPEDLQKIKDDPEANIIFARQDYVLKDGVSSSLNAKEYYLYIKSEDADFLERAEKKLKAKVPSAKRASADQEKKIVEIINKERSEGEQGLGLIFG